MYKITKEEFNKIAFTSKRRSPFIVKLDELELGEQLIVKKSDYKYKCQIGTLASGAFAGRDKKFQTRLLIDNSGWTVRRIK